MVQSPGHRDRLAVLQVHAFTLGYKRLDPIDLNSKILSEGPIVIITAKELKNQHPTPAIDDIFLLLVVVMQRCFLILFDDHILFCIGLLIQRRSTIAQGKKKQPALFIRPTSKIGDIPPKVRSKDLFSLLLVILPLFSTPMSPQG